MLNARCSKFSMQMPKIQKKKENEEKKRAKSKNGTDIQFYMYKPQWNTSLPILCKIAKANCTNSASYDENRKRKEIVLLVRNSRTECLSFGLIFLHMEIL